MKTYVVTRKSDGVEVYKYHDTEPREWASFEFATHNHTELVEPPAPPAPGWEVLDAIDYLKLITQTERNAIRARAKTDPIVEDIVDMQRNSPRVRSNDQDLLDALDYLTAVGILAPGRKQEILNG